MNDDATGTRRPSPSVPCRAFDLGRLCGLVRSASRAPEKIDPGESKWGAWGLRFAREKNGSPHPVITRVYAGAVIISVAPSLSFAPTVGMVPTSAAIIDVFALALLI